MGLRKNDEILKGSVLMVFVNDNPIAFATSHSLSITSNTTEISTKDHGLNPGVLVQSQTFEVTCENLASAESINALFNALDKAKSNETVTLKFAKPGNWADKGIVGGNGQSENWSDSAADTVIIAQGEALITSFSLNAPSGDNATLSATFTGVGPLVLTYAANTITGGDADPVGPGGATGGASGAWTGPVEATGA
jgi:hypothetical protein